MLLEHLSASRLLQMATGRSGKVGQELEGILAVPVKLDLMASWRCWEVGDWRRDALLGAFQLLQQHRNRYGWRGAGGRLA